MKRGRVVAALLLGSLAAACQILAGIQDHPFQLDAPADAEASVATDAPATDASAVPDPCAHVAPPGRPDAGFDDTAGTYVFAVRSVDFSGADEAGAPLGFDLDRVCTCDRDPATSHAGAASCAAPGSVPCDFEGGVDNALYGPFRALSAFLGTDSNGASLLGNQAECGRETLLLVVGDYNGLADDGIVKVGLIPSYGIRAPHDAGEIPDSACTDNTGPPYAAKWDGTDVWSFAEGTAIRKGTDVVPLIVTGDAYVTGYTLVVPPVRSTTIFLGAQAVEVSSPTAIARLVGIDGAGNDVPPGAPGVGFRISDGILTGRISTQALLAAVGVLKPKPADGEYLCNFAQYSVPVKLQTCASRDILSDPVKDFQGLPDGAIFACDALSTAVRFTGQMAQVGDSYSPDGGPEAGCPPEWPTCN